MTPDSVRDVRESIQHVETTALGVTIVSHYSYEARLAVSSHTQLNALHEAFLPVEDQVEDDVADFLVTLKHPNRRTQELNYDLPTRAYGVDLDFPDRLPDLDLLLREELKSNVEWTDVPFRAPSNAAANASAIGIGSKARTAISRLTDALAVLDHLIFGQLEDKEVAHSHFFSMAYRIHRILPQNPRFLAGGHNSTDNSIFDEILGLIDDAGARRVDADQ